MPQGFRSWITNPEDFVVFHEGPMLRVHLSFSSLPVAPSGSRGAPVRTRGSPGLGGREPQP